jgi:hypothetical protein
VEEARVLVALAGLQRLPLLLFPPPVQVGMATLHLVDHRIGHVIGPERRALFAQDDLEGDVEEQVAELGAEASSSPAVMASADSWASSRR